MDRLLCVLYHAVLFQLMMVARSGQCGPIALCHFVPCCLVSVDGGWSEWAVLTDCSVTCGAGSQLRNRTCNNPVPVSNGLDCDGEPTDTQVCTAIPCDGTFASVSLHSSCFIFFIYSCLFMCERLEKRTKSVKSHKGTQEYWHILPDHFYLELISYNVTFTM